MATTEYKGKYQKLFPGILSSNSFLSLYTLHMLDKTTQMYGKEIADGIGERLHGLWEPSHGLVYPLLREMEANDLITGIWEVPDRKTKRLYQITDKGREVLRKEAERAKPMFDNSVRLLAYAMNDIYAAVL